MRKIFWCFVIVFVVSIAMILPTFAATTTNDDAASATSINVGSSYSGELTSESTKDYYKFTLASSGTVNIKVTTTMSRTYYYLYDSNNNKIWGDRYSNGLDQKVELTAGTYYFYVAKSDSLGSYSFSISFSSANESNAESVGSTFNTIESAPSISLGNTYNGQLAINDTTDYYKFTLSESGRLSLDVTTTMARTYYYIYNSSNVKVWGDRYGNGLDQDVDLVAGTYYFYVSKYDNTGNYSFKLSFATASESNAESVGNLKNSIGDAHAIDIGESYNGQLAINDTDDYYKFTLTESGRVSFNVTTTMARTYYYIYNSSNVKVWGDRYSNGLDQDVDLVAGTYYFYVGKYDNTGNYNFKLTFVSANESKAESVGNLKNSIGDASTINLDEAYNGYLAVNDTEDYYKFTIDTSGRVNLQVTTTMARTYYYIYNSSNVKVWGDRYSNGLDQNVDLVAGTYYLYVGKYDNTGTYNFKLSYTSANESFSESLSNSNNTLADATDIQLNKKYIGQLSVNDTVDYYKFTVSGQSKIYVTVTTTMARTYYHIYNSSNVKVWGDRYSEGVDGQAVELGAGTYYFYVNKNDSTGVFAFSLTEEHTCAGSFVTTKEPTCTETGTKEKNCDVCGKLLDTQTISENGHSCDNWVVDKEATCSSEGKRHDTCDVCGETVSENIPMIAHTLGDWNVTKEPTCHNDGAQTRTCSKCDYVENETLTALTHNFGEWSIVEETSCYHAGTEERVCGLCGDKENRTIEQLTHEYGEWEVVSGSKLIPPIVKEKTCVHCADVQSTQDWSYVWVTIVAGVVLLGVLIGVINYIRAFKRR